MAASKKEEILAEAMGSFQTVEVAVKTKVIMLRELSKDERRKLDESLFEMKDGEFVKDKDGYLGVRKEVKNIHDYWIAATATPAFTVEELEAWPPSLRKRLFDEARKINGFELPAVTAKNS